MSSVRPSGRPSLRCPVLALPPEEELLFGGVGGTWPLGAAMKQVGERHLHPTLVTGWSREEAAKAGTCLLREGWADPPAVMAPQRRGDLDASELALLSQGGLRVCAGGSRNSSWRKPEASSRHSLAVRIRQPQSALVAWPGRGEGKG